MHDHIASLGLHGTKSRELYSGREHHDIGRTHMTECGTTGCFRNCAALSEQLPIVDHCRVDKLIPKKGSRTELGAEAVAIGLRARAGQRKTLGTKTQQHLIADLR